MTGEELYKKYKGVKIRMDKDVLGVVCGYDPKDKTCPLIIAVLEGGCGWHNTSAGIIKIHKNNPKGYLWIHNERLPKLSRWQMFLHYLKLR